MLVSYNVTYVGKRNSYVLSSAVCANTICDVWLCIPRIIAADIITTTVPAAAIIIEVFVVLLLSFNLFASFLVVISIFTALLQSMVLHQFWENICDSCLAIPRIALSLLII